MSIFSEIAKHYANEDIKNFLFNSNAANKGIISGVLRNIELSEAKQKFAQELAGEIEALKAQDDKQFFNEIFNLIKQHKIKAQKKCKEENFPEGTYESTLDKMNQFLGEVFEKFNSLKLLDIPNNKSSLNIFRYHAARYLTQNIYEKHHPSLLQGYLKNPRFSNSVAITNKKEALLIEKLDACSEEILREKSLSEEICKKLVYTYIKDLLDQNEKLCESYGYVGSIPLSISFLGSINLKAPKIQPSTGSLAACLQEALNQIGPVFLTVEKKGESTYRV